MNRHAPRAVQVDARDGPGRGRGAGRDDDARKRELFPPGGRHRAAPSPRAFTSPAGWPPGPPGETRTATSVANAASRATPSPSANAQVACHARRDAPSPASSALLLTTVNDARNFPSSLASAAYSTSSAHLAAQSAASRAHHPSAAPLGEHARASSAMTMHREPPASDALVRASNATVSKFQAWDEKSIEANHRGSSRNFFKPLRTLRNVLQSSARRAQPSRAALVTPPVRDGAGVRGAHRQAALRPAGLACRAVQAALRRCVPDARLKRS